MYDLGKINSVLVQLAANTEPFGYRGKEFSISADDHFVTLGATIGATRMQYTIDVGEPVDSFEPTCFDASMLKAAAGTSKALIDFEPGEPGEPREVDGVTVVPGPAEYDGRAVLIEEDEITARVGSVGEEPLPVFDIGEARVTTVRLDDVLTRIEYVARAMSSDYTRPHLAGMNVLPNGRVAATDDHRLALGYIEGMELPIIPERPEYEKVTPEESASMGVIIPATVIGLLMRVAKNSKKTVEKLTFSWGTKGLAISCGPWLIVTKYVESRFPPADKVIPDVNTYMNWPSATVDAKRFEKAAKKLKKLSDSVSILLAPKAFVVRAENREGATMDLSIKSQVDMHGVPWAEEPHNQFNLKYLAEACGPNSVAHCDVSAKPDEPSALVITHDYGLGIAMPMRMGRG